MSEEIIKVLDNLAQKFGIAIDWTNQNVMPYLENLMNRYIQYSIAGTSILLALEIIGIIIFIKVLMSGLKQKKTNEYWEWTDEGMANFITLIILGAILIITVPITIDYLLKSIFIPEIVILDYIKNLI